MNPMRRCLPTLLLCSMALPAQNMPVPDSKGRLLQLFDLHSVVAAADDDPGTDAGAAAAQAAKKLPVLAALDLDPWQRSTTLDIPQFLRRFLTPPLGPGDDLQVLGKRWLALLGSPAQIANAEALLAVAAANRERPVDVAVQLVTVPKAGFEAHVRDLLRDGKQGEQSRWELVLETDAATRLLAATKTAQAATLDAPTITVMPLQRAMVQIANQTAYVKDFEVTRNGDSVVADPVVDVVQDGLRAEVVATFLEADLMAVGIDVQIQQLERPIPQFTTTVGTNTPVTIQLPRVTGVRFQQVSRIRDGDHVVFAAQKVDGDYLLTIVSARPGRPLPK